MKKFLPLLCHKILTKHLPLSSQNLSPAIPPGFSYPTYNSINYHDHYSKKCITHPSLRFASHGSFVRETDSNYLPPSPGYGHPSGWRGTEGAGLRRAGLCSRLCAWPDDPVNLRPYILMNPIAYLIAFAWISLTALSLSIVTAYWLPMLLGGLAVAFIVKMIR